MKPRGVTIWFTGLSGAGKTTIGQAVEKELRSHGYNVTLLDGDTLRQSLGKDLGFTKADREENTRRISEVANSLISQGAIALVCVISPYQSKSRRTATASRFYCSLCKCAFMCLRTKRRKGTISKSTYWGNSTFYRH